MGFLQGQPVPQFPYSDPGAWGPQQSDLTAAIQARIAAAAASGEPWVTLPPGLFYISQSLGIPVSNLGIRGAGMGRTILRWAPGVQMPTTGMLAPADLYGQEQNDILDLTLDANGQNTPAWQTNTAVLYLPSRSSARRIEICNRPTAPGTNPTWLILGEHHDTDILSCVLHDDVSVQVLPAALGAAGAKVVAVASTAGILQNAYCVVDPSVNAMVASAVQAGAQLVPLSAPSVNRYNNGAMAAWMRGIYAGQQLTIGSTAGGDLETVQVQSVDYIGGTITTTAALTKNHAKGAPVLYTGTTETCQVGAVVTNTSFAITTQLAHAGAVAILVLANCGDAVAVGNADPERVVERVRFVGNRGERLGLDLFGCASGNNSEISGNTQTQAVSGYTLTNSYGWRFLGNRADLSYAGVCPANSVCSGFFWLANGVAGSPYLDHVLADSQFIGGAWGIYAAPNAGIVFRNFNIRGVVCRSNGINGMLLSNLTAFAIVGNAVADANANNLANYAGGDVAGIMLNGTLSRGEIIGNDIDDSRGVAQMQCGIKSVATIAGHDVELAHNQISGTVAGHLKIQWGPANWPIVRDNPGFNPVGGAVGNTPPAAPVSGTHYQNTSGVDLTVSLTGGTVSNVTVYDSANANGTTVATATGCVFTLKAGAYFSVTWSAQPTAAYSGQ